uniref:Uncharacterized protein n=1 Tax=Oryza sativa subsp. japonica TaxID=39947 RepID=Q7XII8_ORYSJ|nr:hypothetical protein [Oryza sativa Japonica Group]
MLGLGASDTETASGTEIGGAVVVITGKHRRGFGHGRRVIGACMISNGMWDGNELGLSPAPCSGQRPHCWVQKQKAEAARSARPAGRAARHALVLTRGHVRSDLPEPQDGGVA